MLRAEYIESSFQVIEIHLVGSSNLQGSNGMDLAPRKVLFVEPDSWDRG